MITPTVMIIEDDPDANELMSVYARGDLKLKVEQYYDGPAALARLADPEKEKPALVILDLHLPHVSGEEILEKIRRGENIPVVVVTADVRSAEKLVDKADGVFVKPVNSIEFLVKLTSLLRPRLDGGEGSDG